MKRLGGGDAAALVSYSTEDGTAEAGFDYEAQSGQLLFRRGVDSQDIKIMIRDDDEVGRNKFFSVKLDAAEGGTLDAWWGRARVVVVDDGLRVVEHIKQSYTYSAVSACSTLFALVGNDLLLFLPPANDAWVDGLTLAVLGIFCVDILLSFCEKRAEYGLSVQLLIDVFATLVMLTSVTWFVDWMMATFPASSEVFARGSVARASNPNLSPSPHSIPNPNPSPYS